MGYCDAPIDLDTTDNVLKWNKDVLISKIIVFYDIDFSRWIQAEIHERAFREFTDILFLCVIQILYDEAGVPSIPEVDYR